MSICFATIASGNYLAYVKVLRESVVQNAPDADFQVLLVDRRSSALDEAVAVAGLDARYADQLGLEDFEQLAYKFDVVELNTALKPTFLKRLIEEGHERVVYLDPDIRMLTPPDPVRDALQQAQIVLTPHALAPVMDGMRPSDIDYLRLGTYNLGFIGLRAGPDTLGFLNWWERRCLGQGFNDFTFGVFVDQKWVDLAPSYFSSVHVLRHPGCNVAYWNLHERALRRMGDTYTSNGEPLIFFHFSGVNPNTPHLLSRHQNRHTPEPASPLAALVSDYCKALMRAGHAQFQRHAYGYGRLDDGTPITQLMRRAATCEGVDVRDPFAANSRLQQQLRAHRIVAVPGEGGTSANTLNFDPSDRRLRLANMLVRALARLVGVSPVQQLLRYATFLSWGSNLPAVLLHKPFDLGHRDPR